MKLSRDISAKIYFILDEIIPPVLRDSKFFMYIPFCLIFGKRATVFFDFKERATFMTKKELAELYASIDEIIVDRETDLNSACVDEILKNLADGPVLEVGCGKALLSDKIEKLGHKVTAADIYINEKTKLKYPKIIFKIGNAEDLPFGNNEFNTVICTHTLEHVQDLARSMAELRRVSKKRLIIVVPRQRPYRYTFDLHIHFFPYIHSFLTAIGAKEKNTAKIVGGDIFYIEDPKS